MAIQNEKTINLLRSLGAPDGCPEQLIDPSQTGYEYWTGLSIIDKLICSGQKTTGGNFHPTCTPCGIRDQEFPQYSRAEYMKYCFDED